VRLSKARAQLALEAPRRNREAHPSRWVAIALVASVALAALGGVAGRHLGKHHSGSLARGLSVMVQRPIVLVPLVTASLLCLAYACRRVLLWRKAIAPGPILVAPIQNATRSELPERDLGIQFQRHLSLVNLPASASLGDAPAGEFIHLLKQTDFDVKRPLGLVGGLLDLVVPTHAYEVRVTLLKRSERPSCGVAVEMTILPRRLATFHRFWEESWERALERGAHGVAADVLPRTRLCRGPWATWRGRDLPERLFDHYQQARQKLQDRCFEEALGHYYAALRLDPGNEEIRYELGTAQEKLALWLDALLTYHRAFTAAADSRLRRHPRAGSGRRLRRRMDLLARNRYLSLLGAGERLARQWITTGDRPYGARDRERTSVRWQLREILSERYASLNSEALAAIGIAASDISEIADERALARNELKKRLADPTPGGGRRQEARRRQEGDLLVLFQVLAQHEAKTLLRDTRFQNLTRMKTQITRTSLHITQAWATCRRSRAEGKPPVIVGDDERATYRQVFGRAVSTRLRRSRSYSDHYDAACVFAIPLLHLGRREGRVAVAVDRNALISYAVKELHLALDNAHGGMVSGRWDWIVSEDPDLAELRKTREFRAFESARLPSAKGAPLRPAEVQHLELARHTSALVSTVARRFQGEWRGRAGRADLGPPVDIHQIRDWYSDDLTNWEALGSLSVNHRDWRTRLSWIQRAQTFAVRNDQPPFVGQHPLYSDEPMTESERQIDDATRRHVKAVATRMHELQTALTDRSAEIFDGRGDVPWGQLLTELDERGETMSSDELRRLCHGRAALWAGVATWFETRVDSPATVIEAAALLHGAIDQLLLPPLEAVSQ
jgi:hypothetical protein